MIDLLLKKHVLLLSVFVETMSHLFLILRWIESSEEQHVFEIEIFCNIIK